MRVEIAVHLALAAAEKCDAVQLSLDECYSYRGPLPSKQAASKFLSVATTQLESAQKYCAANREKDFCDKVQSESTDTYQSPK